MLPLHLPPCRRTISVWKGRKLCVGGVSPLPRPRSRFHPLAVGSDPPCAAIHAASPANSAAEQGDTPLECRPVASVADDDDAVGVDDDRLAEAELLEAPSDRVHCGVVEPGVAGVGADRLDRAHHHDHGVRPPGFGRGFTRIW